jgi:succinate dehydrogenase/fumarate reductase flavoprotein subunit
VAETVVAGMIVGENMADFVESAAGELQVSTALVRECLETRAGEARHFAAWQRNGERMPS